MLKLEFLNRSRRPLWLIDKSLTVGRAESNQLVLDDASISPVHARIVSEGTAFVLTDLSSEHGTYINGQAVRQRRIESGDTLRFGEVEVQVIDPYAASDQDQPWLMVASSSWLSGQEFAVLSRTGGESIKVGRGKHCDIILPGTHLSREHAELIPRGDRLLVRDLSSANGTFLNDERVTQAEALAGDKLRFDVYSFRLVGPRAASDNTEARRREATVASAVPTLEPEVEHPKRWQTRPTSPGNREESSAETSSQFWPYLIAGALMITVVVITLYIFWG